MGLLDALKQYVSDSMPGGLLNPEWNKTNGQRLAEELNRGLLESTGINARDKRRAWERNKLDAVTGSSDTKASLNQQAYDSAMAMAGMAPMGLTVWHGSPHKFSKFDMSKIGTGEGAQAYGHGLYMAESPDVAASYKASTRKPEMLIDGVLYKADESGMLRNSEGKLSGALPSYLDEAARALFGSKHNKPLDVLAEEAESFLQTRSGISKKNISDAKQAILDGRIKLQDSGALYKVDIPDEAVARMLDWDKPLSQQAPEVQRAFQKLGIDESAFPHWTGQQAYEGEVRALTDFDGFQKGLARQKYSDQLRDLGIPGIRYLDGGSRAGGQGTSNYVLFSDQLPRILEVNGKPTGQTPWAAGEWQGLLGQ